MSDTPAESFESSPRRSRKSRLRAVPDVGTLPPHDIEAEEYLLSCCLMDGAEVVPLCLAAKFTAATFYDTKHGLVFAQIAALYAAQQPVAIDVVATALKQSGELDLIGGYAFLTQVSSRIPTVAQARFFLERVRATWIRRQIIDRAQRLREAAMLESTVAEPLAEWLSPHVVWFENALARLSHGGRGDVYTLERRIAEVRADVKLRAEGKEDRAGWVWTGFSAFDDLTRDNCLRPFNSLEEDGIVLVGGGSSHGKSVLMRQFAGQALLTGQRVLVYTLETSVKGFIRSLAASWAGVNLLMLDRTPPDLLQKFDDHCAELAEMADKRLFVFQNEPGSEILTIEALARHARSFSMRHGAPQLMLMDYLQRLDTKKRYNSGEQRVAHVSHGFQDLQRELMCCAIGGAQFNETSLAEMRTVKRDENGKVIHSIPTRGALRESQSLYHDADVALFLYRPPEDCRGSEQTGDSVLTPETWIVQAKRRNGRLGICRCWFEKRFGRFRELKSEDIAGELSAGVAATGTIPAGARISKRDYHREGGRA
jgi:replicative DNA helicase